MGAQMLLLLGWALPKREEERRFRKEELESEFSDGADGFGLNSLCEYHTEEFSEEVKLFLLR